jgi:hypothetical protein
VGPVQRVLSVVGMLCELWSYGSFGQGDSGNSAAGTECSGNVVVSWRIYKKSRNFSKFHW